MKWRGRRQSNNVQYSRGGKKAFGGGIFGIIIGLFLWLVMGVNPFTAFSTGSQIGGSVGGSTSSVTTETTNPTRDDAFVSTVLATTEDVWGQIFASQGIRYKEPKLVIFEGRVNSACGSATAATGPFYCPGDQKLYLDLNFFYEMKRNMGITGDLQQTQDNRGKAGDFAQAYVIAHEVGHHIQTLLGISSKVQKARMRMGKTQGNRLSVKQELQADCFAGVWANHSHNKFGLLEAGDVKEAMHAASKIGDDSIQRRQTGTVRPDSFTHGSSEQRVFWFSKGLQTGDVNSCDTFSANI